LWVLLILGRGRFYYALRGSCSDEEEEELSGRMLKLILVLEVSFKSS
jgi:hypothetical protein